MKKIIVFFVATLFSQAVFSQNYYSQFQKHWQEKDSQKQFEVLQKWQKEQPNDAELFTAYFNYHFFKSRKESVALSKKPKGKDNFILKDQQHKTAGYLSSQVVYNEAELKKGFAQIDKGIALYPNRLDMRFGKVFIYGKLKRWSLFTKEIIKSIEQSAQNNNNWTWTQNQKLKDSKNFFLSTIQDYQLQLYNTEEDKLLNNMRNIAQKVLQYYPQHIPSFSNLAVTYLLTGEYDKAINILLKAEKIAPQDDVVLSNIAQGYKLKKDNAKAVVYYKKVLRFGDSDAKKYAREQIKKLTSASP